MSRVVFLSHLSRSGSTLLANRVEASLEVIVAPEAALPREMYGLPTRSRRASYFSERRTLEAYLADLLDRSKLSSWELDLDRIIAGVQLPLSMTQLCQVLMSAYGAGQDSRPNPVVVHKGDPVMPWLAADVQKSFVRSSVLHIVRDPRAVYVSQMKGNESIGVRPFARSAASSGAEWRLGAESVIRSRRAQSTVYVRYEDLLQDSQSALYQIATSLDLRVRTRTRTSESFIDRVDIDERRNLHSLVGGSIVNDRADAWQKDISHVDRRRIEAICGRFMPCFGYRVPLDTPGLASGDRRPLWSARSALLRERAVRRIGRTSSQWW